MSYVKRTSPYHQQSGYWINIVKDSMHNKIYENEVGLNDDNGKIQVLRDLKDKGVLTKKVTKKVNELGDWF